MRLNWKEHHIRAGDKIPHSEDDKPCGDGWIPKEKDCHDGDAHRPSPGENPYWTDENSAEERRDRDVPWDTNKPKSREERDKETEWEPKEEEAPEPEEEAPEPEPEPEPEPAPEPELEPEEAEKVRRESVRQATVQKWAQKDAEIQQHRENLRPQDLTSGALKKYRNKLRRSIDHIATMCTIANMGNYQYPDSERLSPGERAEEWTDVRADLERWREFQPQNQEDVDKIADVLRGVLRNLDVAVGDELRKGHMWTQGFTMPSNGWSFDPKGKEMRLTEDLLDQYENDKYSIEQPQDLLAWDKLRRDPESMQSVTEIPGFRFKGVDPENMTPEQEEFVSKKTAQLDLLFKRWQQNPRSGHGVELAKNLMGGLIRSDEPHLPNTVDSPLIPNYGAAKIIAEKSAKYGSEVANDFMWEEFGVSEEWTSESFIHDYRKAAQKVIRTAQTELKLDIPAFVEGYKALAKLERGAKAAKKRYDVAYRSWFQKKMDLRTQRDSGQIDEITFENAANELNEQGPNLSNEYDAAREAKAEAEYAMDKKADKAREDLQFTLTLANKDTQAQPETIAAILSRVDQNTWRDMQLDKPPADKSGKVSRKDQIDFDELARHRKQVREMNPGAQYAQADQIKDTITRIVGYLHRDLLEGPEGHYLWDLKWQSEVSFRAHADELANAVVLDQNSFPSTATHEFGHQLEFRNRRVKARILDFYNERTDGVKERRLKGYEQFESFKPPRSQAKKFYNEYCSKVYKNSSGQQSVTELLSMGLEALEHRGRFRDILRYDPEHLAIILATVRGY